MVEVLPISKIQIYRGVVPDKILDAKLKKSIKEKGQLAPVVVDQHYVLVDGLRRINALKELGIDMVNTIVSSTLEDTCSAIALSHDPAVRGDESVPIGAARLWELHLSLAAQTQERIFRIKRITAAERAETKMGRTTPGRTLLANALRMASDAEYQNVVTLNNTTTIPGEIGEYTAGLVGQMERGEITIYQAKRLYDIWSADRRKIRDKGRQLQILTRVSANVTGLTKPLDDISRDLADGFTSQELDQLQRDLDSARNSIFLTINKIKRARERGTS